MNPTSSRNIPLNDGDIQFFQRLHSDLGLTPKNINPVAPDKTLTDLLTQYDQEPSDELEKMIICTSIFKNNQDKTEEYLNERQVITNEITKLRRELENNPSNIHDEKISQLEQALTALNEKTTESLWMSDEEMGVRRERADSGKQTPCIWYDLAKNISFHYRNMLLAVIYTTKAQSSVHDDDRPDMARHAVFLLKYYGFGVVLFENSPMGITHPFHREQKEKKALTSYLNRFAYNLMNPTWVHLENEIRNDLIAIGMPKEKLPPLYPHAPKVNPSPVKTAEELSKLQHPGYFTPPQ